MHFGTDAAALMSEHIKVAESPGQRPNPRAEHVRSLARTPFSKLIGAMYLWATE